MAKKKKKKMRGRPPVGVKVKRIAVAVTLRPAIIRKLKTIAERHGISRSRVVESVLEHELGKKIPNYIPRLKE